MQGPPGPHHDIQPDDWQRVFQVNLASAQALCAGLIPAMAQRPLANTEFMNRWLATTPLRRVGDSAEVASVEGMVASRAGGFIAGQTLVVDGGTLVSD